MQIEKLNKDELISHTAEIVSSQDIRISTLMQQRQALITITALVVVWSLLT
jgi:hypothetical protein